MKRRSKVPARIFAILALVAGLAAFLIILSTGLGESGQSGPKRAVIEQTDTGNGGKKRARYVVQNGDTLISISEKTGVSLERIQELNPDLDPQILISGQKLKLR